MQEIKEDVPNESNKCEIGIPKGSLQCFSFTLVLAVYGLAGVGGDPVSQNRRVALLQGYGQVTPLVPQKRLNCNSSRL